MSKKRSKKKQQKKAKAKAARKEKAASLADEGGRELSASTAQDAVTGESNQAEVPPEPEAKEPSSATEVTTSAHGDDGESDAENLDAEVSAPVEVVEAESAPEEVVAAPEVSTKNSILAPEPLANKDAWNPVAVGFNLLGVILAIGLMMVGGKRTYNLFDQLWLKHLGESTGYVINVQAVDGPKGKTRYETTVQLDKKGTFPEAKVKVYDKRLYNYVRHRFHPPRQLRLKVVRVHRTLSNQAGISQAGPLRLLRPPKSADLIIGLGLLVLGGAICFSSLRDLRKRWLRRGLHA